MRRTLSTLCAALALVCASQSVALAQSADDQAAETLLSTTTVALIPVTTSYFVLMWQFDSRKQELRDSVKRLESIVMIEDYLDAHEEDVRFAFTIGAGEPLDDLVALMGRRHEGGEVAWSARRARQPVWREILAIADRRERATRLYDTLDLEFSMTHAQGGAR